MAFPAKPATPTLQASHAFASGLQAAWLFFDSTGITISDFSGNNRHLLGTMVSDGSWGDDGTRQRFLKLSAQGQGASRLATSASIAGLNFASTDPWSLTMLVRRHGAGAGGGAKPRFHSRTGNLIDMGQDSNAAPFALAYFNGAWTTFQESSVSGTNFHFTWTKGSGTGNVLRLYKDGVANPNNPYGINNANTGQIFFGTAPGAMNENSQLDIATIFYHNRELSAAEVLANVSNPYDAFIAPAPPPDVTQPYIGMIERDFYDHRHSYQGGSQHLLDWLAGK